ncbi:MAG: hypothetical protein V3S11_02370, partial [Elusimicrobiota bacterium]
GVSPDSLICQADASGNQDNDWKPLSSVPELAELFAVGTGVRLAPSMEGEVGPGGEGFDQFKEDAHQLLDSIGFSREYTPGFFEDSQVFDPWLGLPGQYGPATMAEVARRRNEQLEDEVSKLQGELSETEQVSLNFKRLQNEMRESIGEKDRELTEKGRSLDDKSKVVDDQNRTLEERSRELTDKSRDLLDKSKVVDDQNQALEEKSQELAEQQKAIEELRARVAELEIKAIEAAVPTPQVKPVSQPQPKPELAAGVGEPAVGAPMPEPAVGAPMPAPSQEAEVGTAPAGGGEPAMGAPMTPPAEAAPANEVLGTETLNPVSAMPPAVAFVPPTPDEAEDTPLPEPVAGAAPSTMETVASVEGAPYMEPPPPQAAVEPAPGEAAAGDAVSDLPPLEAPPAAEPAPGEAAAGDATAEPAPTEASPAAEPVPSEAAPPLEEPAALEPPAPGPADAPPADAPMPALTPPPVAAETPAPEGEPPPLDAPPPLPGGEEAPAGDLPPLDMGAGGASEPVPGGPAPGQVEAPPPMATEEVPGLETQPVEPGPVEKPKTMLFESPPTPTGTPIPISLGGTPTPETPAPSATPAPGQTPIPAMGQPDIPQTVLQGMGVGQTTTPVPVTPGAGATPGGSFEDLIGRPVTAPSEMTARPKTGSMDAPSRSTGESKFKKFQSKGFLVVLGVAAVVMVLLFFMFARNPTQIKKMVDIGPDQGGGQEAVSVGRRSGAGIPNRSASTESEPAAPPQGEDLQQPSAIPPSAQIPPEEQAPPARDFIVDNQIEAMEFVKNYPLGGTRGTISGWLAYSFEQNPGVQPVWSAGALEADVWAVQYSVFEGPAAKKPQITYSFEVNLLRKLLIGRNKAAREVLAGGFRRKAARRKPSRRASRRRGRTKTQSQRPLPDENELEDTEPLRPPGFNNPGG